jgi:hypothetical protein
MKKENIKKLRENLETKFYDLITELVSDCASNLGQTFDIAYSEDELEPFIILGDDHNFNYLLSFQLHSITDFEDEEDEEDEMFENTVDNILYKYEYCFRETIDSKLQDLELKRLGEILETKFDDLITELVSDCASNLGQTFHLVYSGDELEPFIIMGDDHNFNYLLSFQLHSITDFEDESDEEGEMFENTVDNILYKYVDFFRETIDTEVQNLIYKNEIQN